jgi:hypothetical protein
MFYQNIGPFCMHIFLISRVYFSSKKVSHFLDVFFILTRTTFHTSVNMYFLFYSMFFFPCSACFFFSLFFTSMLHVSYFSCACYFSRIYLLL